MKAFNWPIAFCLVCASLNLAPRVTAQDPGECFMQSSSGTVINLGHLCGGGSNSPTANSPTYSPGTATPGTTKPSTAISGRVFRAVIKRKEGKLPIIDVVFNGKHRAEMIVDTGASGTLVTADLAKVLKLKPIGYVQVDTASEQGVTLALSRLESMEVNGAVARNVRVAIAGPSLDIGLLGHDFFENYDVTIKRDVVEFRTR